MVNPKVLSEFAIVADCKVVATDLSEEPINAECGRLNGLPGKNAYSVILVKAVWSTTHLRELAAKEENAFLSRKKSAQILTDVRFVRGRFFALA